MEIHQAYVEELANAVSLLPMSEIYEAAQVIHTAFLDDKKIFLCGNGGSAANASHISADLGKNSEKFIPTICLSDNIFSLTAYANDISYDEVFLQPMARLYSEGDILVAISTSGNSRNVVFCALEAQRKDMTVIGLMGKPNNVLENSCDLSIHIESDNIGVVEDLHLSIGHIWTELIRSW